jgi:UDP-glucose 4-epimerase
MDQGPLVVILGGFGFIGSHLSRALLNLGYRVRLFDKLYASKELIADILSQAETVEGDYERPEDIIDVLADADVCFHLVHTTVPGSSMQDPAYDVQSNVVSSTRWLPRLKQISLKQLIYISSGGTVYGIPEINPITEDHPTNPISSYGITKLSIEKYIALYSNLHGIEYRIARPSNVYGEGQRLHTHQGAIGVFVDNVLHDKPVEIWGDGNIRRDYLYIADLVSALVALIEHHGPSRVFNISSGRGYSLFEIIDIIREITKTKINTTILPRRGFDVPVNILSSKSLQDETGWTPKTSLYEGISRYIKWLRKSQL